MNASAEAVVLAGGATKVAATRAAARTYRLPIYAACTLLAVMTAYRFGKEMGFDTLNYHFYLGFSALHDRFNQDYFAASFRSYFNPYAYVPFYALVSAGLPALAIAVMFAVVQSAILWFTYEIALLINPSADSRRRIGVAVCAVALAYLNPIMMQQFGTSFADITTGELVMGGWLLLAAAVRTPHVGGILGAGLLLGAATALKPTNAIHAIAAATLLAMLPVGLFQRIRYALFCGGAMAGSFVLVSAPWSYRLERAFGNPLFPLFNNLFRSPYFTTERMFDYRFVPAHIGEALWRPFEIVEPRSFIHEELVAPDIRYAALAMLLLLLVLRGFWRWYKCINVAKEQAALTPENRLLAALGVSLACDWIAWLAMSGNGRYFLPGACIASVVLAGLVFRLFERQPRLRNYLLIAIFATQGFQLWMITSYRWVPAPPWGGPWFHLDVPQKLVKEPNLYLTMGVESDSFIAPFINSNSALINFPGDYILGPEGLGGRRIRQLISRFSPHIRMVVRGRALYTDDHLLPNVRDVDDSLGSFGLRVDTSDCETITVDGLYHDQQIHYGGIKTRDVGTRNASYLVSCRVMRESATAYALQEAGKRDADTVLDRVEDACPELFQPRRTISKQGPGWMRRYVNTGLVAWVSRGWVKFLDPIRDDGLIYLGRESAWLKGPLPVFCGRRDGHYFAHIVGEHAPG